MRLRKTVLAAVLIASLGVFYGSHWLGCALDRAELCRGSGGGLHRSDGKVQLSDFVFRSVYTPAPAAVSGTLFLLAIRYIQFERRNAIPARWRNWEEIWCNIGLALLLLWLSVPTASEGAYLWFHVLPLQIGVSVWIVHFSVVATNKRWLLLRVFCAFGVAATIACGVLAWNFVERGRWTFLVWQTAGLACLLGISLSMLFEA